MGKTWKALSARLHPKGKSSSRDDQRRRPPAVSPTPVVPPALIDDDSTNYRQGSTPFRTAESEFQQIKPSTKNPVEPATTSYSLVTQLSANAISQKERTIRPEHFWDQAYDDLKAEEHKLITLYEVILSRELSGSERTENVIAANEAQRRSQMNRLLDIGLDKTAKLAKVEKSIGDAISIVLSVKDAIGSALLAVPVAAVAWTGVCIALQVFQNPITEAAANRDGIVQVVRNMKWYSSLSKLLFDDEMLEKEGRFAEMRRLLADQIRDLYKTLLKYIIKSICTYSRHPALTILRNTVKLDDWSGSLADVIQAENNAKEAVRDFGLRQANSYLGLLVNMHLSKEQDEIVQKCCVTNMETEIQSLQSRKDPLLADSYQWILETKEYKGFTDWHYSCTGRLLWIKGEAGKGKTMLLIGVVRELTIQLETHMGQFNLSYFFCQGTNTKLNTATAVVKGLIWMLLRQERSLICHLETMFKDVGPALFEGSNAFYNLKQILRSMLEDRVLKRVYLVVDALDECRKEEPGLPQLLKLISDFSKTYKNVRWLVSSRESLEIEEALADCATKTALSLESNTDSVTSAVEAYINHKMSGLTETYRKRYAKKSDTIKGKLEKLQDDIAKEIRLKAEGTFLWVALVFKQIEGCDADKALDRIRQLPSGLDEIYTQMICHIIDLHDEDAEQCKAVLLRMVNAYRPLRLLELASLAALSDLAIHEDVVKRCGFLTIKEDENTVFFVHQSAKDYLVKRARPDLFSNIFPHGHAEGHRAIVLRSLDVMSATLHQDIYNLHDFSCSMETVKSSGSSPLLSIEYSCIYWIDHLYEVDSRSSNREVALSANEMLYSAVYSFFAEHFLHWLESLSLLRKLPEGIFSIRKLLQLVQSNVYPELTTFLEDAEKFIISFRSIMERAPLQIYATALIFCPTQTEIKRLYWKQRGSFIKASVGIVESWDLCQQTLEGHSGVVRAVAFSPDGKTIVSGSYDETVQLWDAATGRHLHTLEGHSDHVKAVAFLPNGRTIMSSSADGTIRLWDAATGRHQHTLESHRHIATAVAFSPSSKIVASASSQTIWLWDATTGRHKYTLEGHNGWINAVAFSPNGKMIASCSNDNTVRLWHAATGQHQYTLEGHILQRHIRGIQAVAFSPDSKRVVSGSYKTIRLWDVTTGQHQYIRGGHDSWVNAVAFSPNGKMIASCSNDNTVRLWDSATGRQQYTLKNHVGKILAFNEPSGTVLAFSPDSKTVASCFNDKIVRLWNTTTGQQQHILKGHSDEVSAVVFSPNGKTLMSCSYDNTIRLWDIAASQYQHQRNGHRDKISVVTISPNGKIVASGSHDKTIRLWDTTTGHHKHALEGHGRWVKDIAFSPNSKIVASASNDRTVRLWNAATGQLQHTLRGHGGGVRAVVFSPDSKIVASGAWRTVWLWDAATGQFKYKLGGHGRGVQAVDFSPDGKTLVSCSFRTIRLWDVATGRLLRKLEGHSGWVIGVVFSYDGKRIISESGDAHVEVWNAATGQRQHTPEASQDTSHLLFRPDGQCLRIDQASDRGISVRKDWVVRDGKKLFWLPHDYRPTDIGVYGNMLVLGHTSGLLTFYELA